MTYFRVIMINIFNSPRNQKDFRSIDEIASRTIRLKSPVRGDELLLLEYKN